MRLIPFCVGRTGSAQRSHPGLNSPFSVYLGPSYHTVNDMLWITSHFFPFCLLHLPYFSAFTPDTYSPGFVFLSSHISAGSISQYVFKVKLPAFFFFFFCLFFSRSLCSFFLFSSHSLFRSTTPPKSILPFLPNPDWSLTFYSPGLFCASPPASM